MPEEAVSLDWELVGAPEGSVVVLVHGLGGQRIDWPPRAIDLLVAVGHRVLTYDQRDSGRSERFTSVGVPDLLSIYAGKRELAPYTLVDMANDLVVLLDRLKVERVHLVGVSMGAMVAQQLMVTHPDRVLTITSMLGTTGRASVGQPSELALATLLNPNPDEPLEVVVARPRSGLERAAIMERLSIERRRLKEAGVNDPYATLRQLAAILASPDRSEELAALPPRPSLVVHGTIDPLVHVSGGYDTFRVLAGSRLLLFAGLGHDLPEWCWDRIAAEMLVTIREVGG